MAGTTDDIDHAPIDRGGDDDTMTDDVRRAPVTRVLELPPPVALPGTADLGSDAFVERFQQRELLGRGGMGEVTAWRDARIGREVAVKRMLPGAHDDATARARFLREARVQGQLEHPAIVPVYDLREDADGSLLLTMKRVRGQTLAALLAEHTRSDVGGEPSRRLLSAFASVCLAIGFAHARGVVHRDLKPGNIMLGDFGEVYVLDWGLAKIVGEPADDVARGPAELSPSAMTQQGSVLGTLGYMAPEQLDDSLGPTSAASDVYSLGAILFELLTGEPLLVAPSPLELVQRTLAGVDARARVRAPSRQIPPELEDLCMQATARLPSARGLSARALHDGVERYLEGDRDRDRRRILAAAHIDDAVAALGAVGAHGAVDAAAEASARARAMRELGAAIALDPGNADAGRAVVQLLGEPPQHVPAAVREELAAMDEAQVRRGSRLGLPVVLSWLSVAPFAAFMGVRDWRPLVVMVLAIAAIGAVNALALRRERMPLSAQIANFLLLGVLAVGTAFVAGPLVMVPTVIAAFVGALQAHPSLPIRRAVAAGGGLLFLMLASLEWAGVLPTAWAFVDGVIHIHPVALGLPETPTRLLIMVSAFGSIVAVGLYISSMRQALAAAQQRLLVVSWHLRQMVPGAAPDP